ncbi:MAG: hypothetical protein Q4F97_11030 [Bacteroidales bacterium]|nr:hypothetical protein [Bacteroidales bacterium]
MERLSDRSIYSGERIVSPGIIPKERMENDATNNLLGYVDKNFYDGGYIVLNVKKDVIDIQSPI